MEAGCLDCGEEWQPEDIDFPGACPSCGGERWKRLRCRACRLNDLDAYESTAPGQLLQRALSIRTAARLELRVTLDDVAADELRALEIVEEERARFERDREQESRAARISAK